MIILGPDRLPRAMGTVGSWVRELRRLTREFRAEFDEEIKLLQGELDTIREEAELTRKELEEIRSDIETSMTEVQEDIQQAGEDMKEEPQRRRAGHPRSWKRCSESGQGSRGKRAPALSPRSFASGVASSACAVAPSGVARSAYARARAQVSRPGRRDVCRYPRHVFDR